MDKKHIVVLLLGILILFSWSSSPPSGRSGAPGEGSCSDSGCHSSINSNINGDILLKGLPETIEPNATYKFTLELKRLEGNPRMAGFQMVAINDIDEGTGQFTSAGPNSTIVSGPMNKTYFQHFPVINFNNDSTVTYTVDWVAPPVESISEVRFFIAANFADGNGSPSNDRIILKSFSSVPDTLGAIDADNDGFTSDTDCDDSNPDINPDAPEIADNDVDENCDGIIAVTDADNDGFSLNEDCDDTNRDINPDATEIADNDIDENCDGILAVTDADNDGFSLNEDCDDTNPDINPDATEIVDNEVDENCDGIIVVTDADNDGFSLTEDCDDTNPDINPDATEIADNDIDENCDGILAVTDSMRIVKGSISTLDNMPIGLVRIIINGQDTLMAGEDGSFTVTVDSSDTIISLSFLKNTEAANGVSALDFITIVNHILGRNVFTQTDQLEAADVNGDGRISSLDLVQITNVILGRWDRFPDQPSWKFSPERIVIDLSDTTALENIRVTGIKTGDVTGDANPER